jgi:hypothetical protein
MPFDSTATFFEPLDWLCPSLIIQATGGEPGYSVADVLFQYIRRFNQRLMFKVEDL